MTLMTSILGFGAALTCALGMAAAAGVRGLWATALLAGVAPGGGAFSLDRLPASDGAAVSQDAAWARAE